MFLVNTRGALDAGTGVLRRVNGDKPMHSVYLIRHGKSSLDGEEADRGLHAEGIRHAEQIADRVAAQSPPVAAIYSSPYRRAILTAEPLSKRLDLEIAVEDDLHEKVMSTGPVDDLAAARRRMWEDFDYKLAGGESNTEAQARALGALERVRQAHSEDAVAVATHGTLIALILNAFDPTFGYEAWRAMPMPDIFRLDFPASGGAEIRHVGVPEANGFQVKG